MVTYFNFWDVPCPESAYVKKFANTIGSCSNDTDNILHEANVNFCDCQKACAATPECNGFSHEKENDDRYQCYIFSNIDEYPFLVDLSHDARCYVSAPRNKCFWYSKF